MQSNDFDDRIRLALSRRAFLTGTTMGLGAFALASLLGKDARARDAAAPPPWQTEGAKAKQVVMVFLSGGLSQIDTFDEKPILNARRGEQLPDSIRKGQRITGVTDKQGSLPVVGSCFKFRSYGKSGLRASEVIPELASLADDLCVVRSVQTDFVLHEAAQTMMFTGSSQLGRPSFGAWVAYALGSANENLPEFIVLLSGQGAHPVHSREWANGFLPGRYHATQFRSGAEPVLFVDDPPGLDKDSRTRVLDAVRTLNEREAKTTGDPDVQTRIQAYEMAARMQTSVPELTDLKSESAESLERYGAEPGKASFANNCLLTRRLLERGVRFVQLCDRGWDHHFNIPTALRGKCEEIDRPLAALITDLKEKGLFDSTIFLMTGEFGRTSYCEGPLSFDTYGRDHNSLINSVVLAGGGFKRGVSYGTTDDWGWSTVENAVHVHDLHATMLHQLGLDHMKLTYRFMGRDFRLTDVAGKVVGYLLA